MAGSHSGSEIEPRSTAEAGCTAGALQIPKIRYTSFPTSSVTIEMLQEGQLSHDLSLKSSGIYATELC